MATYLEGKFADKIFSIQAFLHPSLAPHEQLKHTFKWREYLFYCVEPVISVPYLRVSPETCHD